MQGQSMESIKAIFQSRLTTLEHFLKSAQTHFSGGKSFLQAQFAPDMLSLGTQIACTCNQPRNFALWCNGQPMDNLDPSITSLAQAYEHTSNTKALVSSVNVENIRLNGITRIDLGKEGHLKLSSSGYVDQFLIPNFYFHLVTAYDILRTMGVPIGKRDYMRHLEPVIQKA